MSLFSGKESDPSTLSEVLGQGAGAVSACWSDLGHAGIFQSECASDIVQEMQEWIEAHYEEVIPGSLHTDLGPEIIINEDGTIIGHKGFNFYKSCDAYVCDNPHGGMSFCVKRVDHPGNVHESFNGNTRIDDGSSEIEAWLAERMREETTSPSLIRHNDGSIGIDWHTSDNQPGLGLVKVLPEVIVEMVKAFNLALEMRNGQPEARPSGE